MTISTEQIIDEDALDKLFNTYTISFSLSDIKNSVPRINFKRVKLDRFKNVQQLNRNLLEISFPLKRETTEQFSYETNALNPLRKKQDTEETTDSRPAANGEPRPPRRDDESRLGHRRETIDYKPQTTDIPQEAGQSLTEELQSETRDLQDPIPEKEILGSQLPVPSSQLTPPDTKDITFNLEAQVLQQEENVILSPSIVSLPPFKEDIVSTSGEQPAVIWPPVKRRVSESLSGNDKLERRQLKQTRSTLESRFEATPKAGEAQRHCRTGGKKNKRKKSKKKPYFIASKKQEPVFTFPWMQSKKEEKPLEKFENIVPGGLETELLDLGFGETTDSVLKEQSQEQSKIIFKAFAPQIPQELPISPENTVLPKDIESDSGFPETHKINYDIEYDRKAKQMFGKYGNFLTPARVIIWGGLSVTLGYLLWSGLNSGNLKFFTSQDETSNQLVTRDLFKKTHIYKKQVDVSKEDTKSIKSIAKEGLFKPITEQQRLALIQKAKESIENRLDPFGQDAVLPPKAIEEKLREDEEKPPEDIPLERKQVELVGVISTSNKNIALVNVYTADYTVNPQDDKTTRETKLKTTLSMAVPDRIEISLLDAVEDWYVKQIIKGKARDEDPVIELVKGSKKFKLRVGQRVLLPEEKSIEEIQAEIEAQKKDKTNKSTDEKSSNK